MLPGWVWWVYISPYHGVLSLLPGIPTIPAVPGRHGELTVLTWVCPGRHPGLNLEINNGEKALLPLQGLKSVTVVSSVCA